VAKIKIKNISKIIPTIKRAVGALQKDISLNLAEKIREEVVNKIPDKGGWYKIYRESIKVIEDNNTIKVVGKPEVSMTTLPAAETVLFIEGVGGIAAVLQVYNPWPIDMLPAIQGGVTVSVRAVPSSLKETNTLREELYPQMGKIRTELENAGATIVENGMPKINGKIYVDMGFLSKRLEFGIGPFPPIPHWRPAINKAKSLMNDIIKDSKSLNKEIEKGLK